MIKELYYNWLSFNWDDYIIQEENTDNASNIAVNTFNKPLMDWEIFLNANYQRKIIRVKWVMKGWSL